MRFLGWIAAGSKPRIKSPFGSAEFSWCFSFRACPVRHRQQRHTESWVHCFSRSGAARAAHIVSVSNISRPNPVVYGRLRWLQPTHNCNSTKDLPVQVAQSWHLQVWRFMSLFPCKNCKAKFKVQEQCWDTASFIYWAPRSPSCRSDHELDTTILSYRSNSCVLLGWFRLFCG